jgi:hypothetical protein
MDKQTILSFDPKKHEYSVGDAILTSVTKFIGNFFQPFDREYWADYVAKRDGKSTQEVLHEWIKKRDHGTNVHQLIEDHLKGKYIEHYPNEVQEAIDFLQTLPSTNIIPEMKVHAMEWKLAGTIDAVIETPQGIILLDWKTTPNIKMDNPFQQAKPPIHHLDDCNYIKYALQLNMYKAILEQQGKKVIDMGLVKLEREKKFEHIPVKDFSTEVYLMMEHWKNHNT